MTTRQASIRFNGREVQNRAGRVAVVAVLAALTPFALAAGLTVFAALLVGAVVLAPALAVVDVALRVAGRRGFFVREGGGYAVLLDAGAFRRR